MNQEFSFTVMTKDLQKALGVAIKNIRPKPTVPMLANIHLIANENKLEIQAVEATESIAVILDAEVEVPGECVVEAKLMANIVDHIDEERLFFSKENYQKMCQRFKDSCRSDLSFYQAGSKAFRTF